MKGSEFFCSANLLHYHLQKTSPKGTGSSYIDSPEWLRIKKAINAKNNDDNYFWYALTVALNNQNYWKKTTKNIKNKVFY